MDPKTDESDREVEPAADSIPDFCKQHGISRSHYYRLRDAGLGPVEMKVGHRRIVSRESAARWRKQRETAA